MLKLVFKSVSHFSVELNCTMQCGFSMIYRNSYIQIDAKDTKAAQQDTMCDKRYLLCYAFF